MLDRHSEAIVVWYFVFGTKITKKWRVFVFVFVRHSEVIVLRYFSGWHQDYQEVVSICVCEFVCQTQ